MATHKENSYFDLDLKGSHIAPPEDTCITIHMDCAIKKKKKKNVANLELWKKSYWVNKRQFTQTLGDNVPCSFLCTFTMTK